MNRFKRSGLKTLLVRWIDTVLKNHVEKHSLDLNSLHSEIDHVVDYLQSKSNVSTLQLINYPVAVLKAAKWVKKLTAVAHKIVETEVDLEVKQELGDGFKIVKLLTKDAYVREGKYMGNCVASYWGKVGLDVLSLRDSRNMPHCTIEINYNGDQVQQIKGKGNGSVHPKYIKYIVAFFIKIGIKLNSYEMKNLGYTDLDEIDDELGAFLDSNFNGVKWLSLQGKKYFYHYSMLKLK